MRIGGSKRTGNRWARKSRFSVPTNGTAASIAIQGLQSLLYICIGGDSTICTTRVSSAWWQAPLRDKRSPRNTPFHIDGIPCHVHKVDNDVDHKLYNRQSDCDANRNGHHTFHNAPSRCILCKTFLHKHRNALFVPGSLICNNFSCRNRHMLEFHCRQDKSSSHRCYKDRDCGSHCTAHSNGDAFVVHSLYIPLCHIARRTHSYQNHHKRINHILHRDRHACNGRSSHVHMPNTRCIAFGAKKQS